MTAGQPELRSLTGELLAAMVLLSQHDHDRAALVLLYSSIDILAALTTPDGNATRESFVRWAGVYLMPEEQLGCTSLELYAARCGVLHALSSESRLSADGHAREFAYVDGMIDARAVSGHKNGRPLVVLHCRSLRHAFVKAVEGFVTAVDSDASLAGIVRVNLGRVYTSRDQP